MNKNIVLCGVGGQGIVLAAKLLAAAAQEKGLKQKEMESLQGDKSLDFDESAAVKSGDAPGFLVLLAIFAAVLFLSRRWGAHRFAARR